MLWWALAFFVVAIIAAVLGFGTLASAAATVAQIVFYIALAMLVISLFVYLFRGARGSALT
ncbi:DUF1328 domain-containing protein [Lujinxingia vulgaris]|uniref:UPF0391 membrane protein FRC98_16350 n=1 Tax=Lujinxingia vulgaris TaxID=2600176 RepID=A0A5C6X2K2_9DELT|nr:DUF1328 domain-containing protein [Lujinxingia vulgaris]TXD35386.1 DUF1328 domain-containing protein [Lujinxingia vulgaris]